MTAMLDPSTISTSAIGATPAERLRTTMAACRVQFTWLGTQKTLTPEQRARAAETFDAQGTFLSAGKKLLDQTHPAFKAVTAVRGMIGSSWKNLTLPYTEPGVRLIPQDKIEEFDALMSDFRVELNAAVEHLDDRYGELKAAAVSRLGSLYNPADYPRSLVDLFAVAWDFPSVEPPDYLRQLCPQVYEQERARVAGRFEEAVRLAESAFLDEFTRLVEHLTERISGVNEDGTPKVFRESAIGNLVEFFDRFRTLNVRSNDQLDALVEQAQQAVRGVKAQDLRDSEALRQRVASRLAGVQSALDGLLVDQPRRRILRDKTTTGEA